MTGSKRKLGRRTGAVVQERDRIFFRELASVMRVVDREQAQIAFGLRSMRRTNRRLLKLVRAGFLRQIFIANSVIGQKALYALSPNGAALIGAAGPVPPLRQSAFGASPFLLHRLAINEIYLTLKYQPLPRTDLRLVRWTSFRETLSAAIPLTPDGYFEIGGRETRAMFLEADLGTEGITVWQKKIQLYLQLALSGKFTELFRQNQFRVLIVATSDRRLRNIQAEVSKATDKIFWLSTFQQIKQRGFWSPVWLRPSGTQPQPLL